EASRARMVAHAALLVWQAVPVLFLSFFNYQGFPGQPPSLSPIRYYLVTYPAPFITSGLGVMALANLGAPGRRPLRLTIFGLGLILLASHIAFDHIYLTVLERSGRMISYRWPNMAPNMRTMMEVRDILLGEARLDRDAHYERTHSQQLGLVYFGEATFDWLITQDPRSVTNPPSDPHTRWLLHSRYVNPPEHSAEPRLPPGAEEVRRWTIRDIGITIVEYRVVDPLEPVPEEENFMMRNFYHREGRMLYLGPERELRERTRP
ncbi:hypothetical protein JXA47_01805, partial [Candidatus Sumerlaeota bacterium]|nr:hypothetical protein [Candidatus Sumerlaeota bacterium]